MQCIQVNWPLESCADHRRARLRSLATAANETVPVQETYAYAKTLLDCATANPDGRPRALLVGGGIANFTDVAATFKGIIKVRLSAQLPQGATIMHMPCNDGQAVQVAECFNRP